MMMSEANRQAMMDVLMAKGCGLWTEVQSELQGGGTELPIWVLVTAREAIAPALEVILEVTAPFRAAADDTAVSVSFDEFRDGRLFHWNHVEPEEVRTGKLMFGLGEKAVEWSTEDSVYDTVNAHTALMHRMKRPPA